MIRVNLEWHLMSTWSISLIGTTCSAPVAINPARMQTMVGFITRQRLARQNKLALAEAQRKSAIWEQITTRARTCNAEEAFSMRLGWQGYFATR